MEYQASLEVFLLRDNEEDLEISQDREPVDLSGVTRLDLNDSTGQWTVSTETQPTIMSTAKGNGLVTFKLGSAAIPVGEYSAWLILYDTTNTAGLVFGPLRIVARSV